ncbi:glycoside hydrolase family 43 protein [Mucilaginibacter gotjawali]|uniref:Extracellular exo-alpha-(1->5)-L-arabinofuranosidase n=2 Tax=Mucilaginibacter gotjawali TaxID=1550579 RepID=A0A0X8X2N5_9SPHI|nr:glycoside hydrolase family 43 protein [Mucilaginibacter gotjawali]MBB3053771.1 GH43 family beta-xylosidase [Mucilaginibacter gotjawali]BAU54033.1 Extracellular exo-alpha-(1->5)-L-arabinofuranosidase precursor [Mucilaginibacter gotjawali]
MKVKKCLAGLVFLLIIANAALAQVHQIKTYTNPLLPAGADPWVIYKDGCYYYTNSTGRNLTIWKTRNMADLDKAKATVVWVPPAGTAYSNELWAPELHYLQGKWYMYFAADDGDNNHHRIYVIENTAPDPTTGHWVFKGQVTDDTNKWAIDVSVFENKGRLYMIWSGWESDQNGEQDIYIAALKDPYTVGSKRVRISRPEFDWEQHGDLGKASNPPHVNVNEGPEILQHGDKLFLVYSASGCWTDYYSLGMLTATVDANLLDPNSWRKFARPVFMQSEANGVYAPGHNSFFKSPDGKQDWILYHANPKPGCGCDGQRSPRMQQFTWRRDGTPDFGIPLKTGIAAPAPVEAR